MPVVRGTDVATMMTRVETVLAQQARQQGGAAGVISVPRDGGSALGLDRLHQQADVVVEFPSGSARPVVGPAIRFAKRLVRRGLRWYVGPIMAHQSRFNHAVLDVAERLVAETEKLVVGETQRLRRDQEATVARVESLRADVEAGAFDGAVPAATPATSSLRPSTRRSLQYRAFEDRHRGCGADVAKLLSQYVPMFAGCRRVVDLGCGRGEFLTLLRDAGISAYGVDSDESMVEAALAQDLEVVLGDAVGHLKDLDAGAVDGVFSSQVAEHLATDELLSMLDGAYQKLAPGGVIVVETPNPESLFIFAAFFYVDLTHVKPIHPEAMRWALEVSGFEDVRIHRILPVPEGTRLDPLPAELAAEVGWSTIAANIDRLNALLYGPQHFAAVATKAGLPSSP
jgi:SAM-dependent methyltransferase